MLFEEGSHGPKWDAVVLLLLVVVAFVNADEMVRVKDRGATLSRLRDHVVPKETLIIGDQIPMTLELIPDYTPLGDLYLFFVQFFDVLIVRIAEHL